MDDIVVKSKRANDLVNDLEVAFKCLREKGNRQSLMLAGVTSLMTMVSHS